MYALGLLTRTDVSESIVPISTAFCAIFVAAPAIVPAVIATALYALLVATTA